jgi:hypothetical protein
MDGEDPDDLRKRSDETALGAVAPRAETRVVRAAGGRRSSRPVLAPGRR